MRRTKADYRLYVFRSPGWGDNGGLFCTVHWHCSEEDALTAAAEQTARMREKGAASEIRCVVVRHHSDRDRDKLMHLHSPRYRASYYDPGQALTQAEAHSARVHDWHAGADRMNAHQIRNGSQYRTGYGDWLTEWGPIPTRCPHCGRMVRPDD